MQKTINAKVFILCLFMTAYRMIKFWWEIILVNQFQFAKIFSAKYLVKYTERMQHGTSICQCIIRQLCSSNKIAKILYCTVVACTGQVIHLKPRYSISCHSNDFSGATPIVSYAIVLYMHLWVRACNYVCCVFTHRWSVSFCC